MEKLYPVLWFILGTLVAWAILMFPRFGKGKPKGETSNTDTDEFSEPLIKAENVLIKTTEDSSNAIIMISKSYFLGISGFHSENMKLLEAIETDIEEFNQRVKRLKTNTYRIIQQLQQDSIETGHYYVQIVDYLREMAHSIKYVVKPLREHLMNEHKPFAEDQHTELTEFSSQVTDFLNFALHIIKESRFEQIEELILKRQALLELMQEQGKRHIRRIKRKETNGSNSVLYFGVMSETKHLLLQTVNLLKATRDFVSYTKS
jgi:Na+/phosphate symporter